MNNSVQHKVGRIAVKLT